jgi:hypothetical protein
MYPVHQEELPKDKSDLQVAHPESVVAYTLLKHLLMASPVESHLVDKGDTIQSEVFNYLFSFIKHADLFVAVSTTAHCGSSRIEEPFTASRQSICAKMCT